MAADKHHGQLRVCFCQGPGHVKGHARQATQASALHGWQSADIRLFTRIAQAHLSLMPGAPVSRAVQARGPGTPLFDPEVCHAVGVHVGGYPSQPA